MSPRLLSGFLAPRLGVGALLLAVLLPSAARAQGPDGEPFTSVVDGQSYLGNTPLRIWTRTRGYGEETSETAFGTHWGAQLDSGVAFVDGQFRIGNSDTDFSLDLGGGFRWRADDFFTGSPRIFGVSFWYDGEDTKLENYFNQLGVSFERLGPAIDLRLNANIPLEDTKTGDDTIFTRDATFSGNNLAQGTLVSSDVPLRVVDFEAAPRIFNLNAWAYGGGYQMDGDGISELGYRAGVRGYVTNDLAVDVGVSDDDEFGTNTVVQVIWTPGRVTPGMSSWAHTIDDRMREQVYRNMYVATKQITTAGAVPLTDANGGDIRIVHVDSNAAPGGDGSFEAPLNALTNVQANSQAGDIVLVHATSTFTGQNVTLKDSQRLLGEGNSIAHQVTTSQLGTIDIPESFAGAFTAANPLIQNAPGAGAVILAGGNDSVENLAEIEVSNLRITGGTSGIVSPGGIGDVNINNMDFTNTTSHAINIKPLVETLVNNTTRVRFTPTIDEVTFTGVGGDDIHLDAEVGQPATTPIVETIAISDYTSDDGAGVGINLLNTKRAIAISNIDWDGGATGLGALRIENAGTQSNVTLSGTNTITDGAGFGIALVNGAGAHNVTGTTITNTGGDTILASGGTGSMNFTGFITQDNNGAAILLANNGHDGSLTFRELTAGAGVATATDGNGLQFDNADGVYNFVNGVTLTGTEAGVNVINGSSAVITLADATITNPTGVAVNFDGGDANMTFTGRIVQETNAFAVLNVVGGHDGTLIFNEGDAGVGVIRAITGTGLQFNNADGAYTFNDNVELNGGDAGVDVIGGSDGTFTFADADITNPTDDAVVIQGSSAIFTYSGSITANNNRAVLLGGNSGGSVTFNSTISKTAGAEQGILIQNNTGGTYRFAGAVTLNTATNDGVSFTGNSGGSTRFDDIDVTTTDGDAFVATGSAGHSIQVLGSGNTLTSGNGVALNLQNATVGASGITFASVTKNGTGQGINLNGVTGGAVNIGSQGASFGDGGTIASAGDAVSIVNAANVSLNNMILSSTGGQGVDYSVTTSAASRLTLNRNNISNTSLEGVLMDVSGAATQANITLANNTIANSDDEGVLLSTSGATIKTVNLLVSANNISNTDATAPAASFQAGQSTNLNANVLGNTFNNTDPTPGRPFEMASNTASSTVRLSLKNNTASAVSGDEYFLEENAGTFSVEDLGTVDADNGGEVNFSPNMGAFTDDPGNIPTP